MNVLHLGVFDRNIGDNIALQHIHRSLEKHFDNVHVTGYSLEEFWRFQNDKDFVRKVYNDFVNKIDYIIVGGGGLLEYGGYERTQSGWKLPFWNETLRFIKKPIVFYGVGVNIFRGGIEYSEKAKEALEDTIEKSTAFAVRNDGSYDKLVNWIGIKSDKVEVIPDPGLLHLDRFNIPRKDTVTKIGFQPAINNSNGINNGRFGKFGLQDLKAKFKKTICFPHTDKDFVFGKPIITKDEFHKKYKWLENLDEYLEHYKQIDFVIAMRGHGQMITIGMNIPGIYLSTQDKVRDFSLLNGFEDYNVDMEDPDWEAQLEEKEALMREPNSSYLRRWYEIRDEFIKECHEIDDNFIIKHFK